MWKGSWLVGIRLSLLRRQAAGEESERHGRGIHGPGVPACPYKDSWALWETHPELWDSEDGYSTVAAVMLNCAQKAELLVSQGQVRKRMHR